MRTLTLHRLDLAPTAHPDRRIIRVDPREAVLTATDLAATRGDGIFETVVVVDGIPQALEPHLDRFARSAALLDLPAPDRDLWRSAVRASAAALHEHAERGAVKFVLSRGDEAAPGTPTGWALGFTADDPATAVAPEVDVVLLDRGYRHDVAQTSPWLLQGAKTLSYALNMAAQREAHRRGAHDVIFTSIDGYVLEGPNSTVLARIDGAYVTPPVDMGILPGTTQADAFAALDAAGEQTVERPVEVTELRRADAIWLCSSTRGAAPVRSLDGTALTVDSAVTTLINDSLRARRA